MPGFDRKGPEGLGPRTGRQLGKCRPVKDNADENQDQDRLGGRGRRMRRNQSDGSFRRPGRRMRFGRGKGRKQ